GQQEGSPGLRAGCATGTHPRQHPGVRQAGGRVRWRTADRAGTPARRSDRGHGDTRLGLGRRRRTDQEIALLLPAHPRPPAPPAIVLGWQRINGLDGVARDYYVRQFHDWKGGVDVENVLVPGATLYARICGATMARAHARWGDRIAISSYLGKGDAFDRAIAD